MYKTTVTIDGMAGESLEARVSDAIRSTLEVNRVSTSRRRREAVIISEHSLPDHELRTAIEAAGCRPGAVVSQSFGEDSLWEKIKSFFA